jgi:hypothetical protein
MKKGVLYTILLYFVLSLASCSATKFVPEGSYLLDEVKIHQRTNPKDLNRPNNDVRPVKPEQREKEQQIEKEKQQLERQQRTNPRRPLRRQNN